MSIASSTALDRAAVLDRFLRIRARTRAFFDLLDPSVYYKRPITLRNPIVFYEGHLPAFAVNTLVKKGLGESGIDTHLETIFARGIDPDEESAAIARGNPAWPSRAAVEAYAAAADQRISAAIASADLERPGHPLLHGAQALWAILEHEEMHQETLAYMWHQLPYEVKRKPDSYRTAPPRLIDRVPSTKRVRVPGGRVTLGTNLRERPFGWDNELPPHTVEVDAFSIDVHAITNAQFLAFVEAGGYTDPRWWQPGDIEWLAAEQLTAPLFWQRGSANHDANHDADRAGNHGAGTGGDWLWRGMFEAVPLPLSWPVYVTAAEAQAYARWAGRRLMTEAEFHRAAYGTPSGEERPYPWGHSLAPRPPANFDFMRWDPDPVDAHPQGASAFGVLDLVGNGWEWTSNVFEPFTGFEAMASYPEYSADFFDASHIVLKGASPTTARGLVRPGFRNWFRPRYPYVYAKFRCVSEA